MPTEFQVLHILKNLNVKEVDEENVQLAETIKTLKHHVIGTQTSDLSQIYNGRIEIQGSLRVKDVSMFSPRTQVVVSEKKVPQNITTSYWMKSLTQEIGVETFTLRKIEAANGNFITSFLNGHPIREYLTTDGKASQAPVAVRFEKASVIGDVKGHKGNVPSLLFHLSQIAVPRQGLPVIIQSSVEFRGNLSVRDLSTNAINDRLASELTHLKQKSFVFTAPKTVKKLQVKHLNVEAELDVRSYNNIQAQSIANEFIRIDKPINLDSLKVKTFDTVNLKTEFFEDHQFNEFIENLDKEFQLLDNRPNRAPRNVRVFGNVDFQRNIFLTTFNQKILFNEFVNMLAMKDDAAQAIGGKKTFQQNVIVKDHLTARLLNGFPVERLLHKSLVRGEPQTIVGNFFAKKIRTKLLQAKALNNITWNQFVDKTKLHLPLKVNLNVAELKVENMFSGSSSFDVRKMMELIEFPKRMKWDYVTVEKHVDLPVQTSSYLDRLIMLSVYKKGAPQVISGNVEVNSNQLYIKQLSKYDGVIVAKSVPVVMQQLLADSLKDQSSVVQTISGIKTFLAPFYAKSVQIGSQAYYKSNEINTINIVDLNRTIIRPTNVIATEKAFSKLHAEQIELKGRINGIQVESVIYAINNEIVLPRLNIRHLQVKDLSTFMFNQYSLLNFLENRMRKFYGPEQEVKGFLTFASLDLQNDTILSSINNVLIDDAVFLQSDQLQDIVGPKIVAGKIKLIGPAIITNLNGKDFNDFVKNSVSRHQNHVVEKMELSTIDAKAGLVAKHSINGHRIEELLSSAAHSPKLIDLKALISQLQHQLKELNNEKKLRAVNSKRLLYIDYDPNIRISPEGERSVNSRCADNVVMPLKYNSIVVREKRDMEMVVEVPSMTITVSPSLQCRNNFVTSKHLEVGWAYKNGNNDTYAQNFRFTNDISDVKFVETKNGVILMILTMQNPTDSSSEIHVLALNKNDHDWVEHQEKFTKLNAISRSAIVDTTDHTYLVVSSFNDESPSSSDYMMILVLDPTTNKFVKNQQIPGEKFDIILSITIAPKSETVPRTFLLLSRERGKTLYIYRVKEGSDQFTFQRKISFEHDIVEVVVLYIKNDLPYFITSDSSGDFCIFEWRGIESWKSKLCGHFENINQIKSYEYLKRQHLFLTSTINSGTALTIYRQGESF